MQKAALVLQISFHYPADQTVYAVERAGEDYYIGRGGCNEQLDPLPMTRIIIKKESGREVQEECPATQMKEQNQRASLP
jgi:hypothetical protein